VLACRAILNFDVGHLPEILSTAAICNWPVTLWQITVGLLYRVGDAKSRGEDTAHVAGICGMLGLLVIIVTAYVLADRAYDFRWLPKRWWNFEILS